MSTIGPVKGFYLTMTTGITLTAAIDLGGSYGKILLGIPTMSTGTETYIKASDKSDGVFRRVYHAPTVATATPTVVTIVSAISNCYVPVVVNAQFLKIEHSTAASDTSHTYNIIGSAN